tara:strand:- start:287 stop:475 length:189 start_codon:yes stop_codon:yes gene_type:complete
MLGEHGFLSRSLLSPSKRAGATRAAGSSTATEQCDLRTVETEPVETDASSPGRYVHRARTLD